MEINPIRITGRDDYENNDERNVERNDDEITLPKIEEKEEINEKCEDDCMPDFDDIIDKGEPEEEEEEEINSLFGKVKKGTGKAISLPKNALLYFAMGLSLIKFL